MKRLAGVTRRWKIDSRISGLREAVASTAAHASERLSSYWRERGFVERLRSVFRNEKPPMSISRIAPPLLLVLMGGTTVRQYEHAGQLGRLASALESYAKSFRTVYAFTTDRKTFTDRFESDRVHHVRLTAPVLPGRLGLIVSVLLRFRSVRKATSVLVLDEEAAVAGWLAQVLSGAPVSLSAGAPWSPPRKMATVGWRHWLTRSAFRRISQVSIWPGSRATEYLQHAEATALSDLVDADIYCPLTTTDPERPRTVGVFLRAGNEVDARVLIGVAERLARRGQRILLRGLVDGETAELFAASLRAEAAGREAEVEFEAIPRPEMLPGALSHLRMCVAFDDPYSVRNLLRAMSSGIPAIAVRPETDEDEAPGWTRFVLKSGASEEQISNCVEALFREPVVRLRLAREGRRYVVARHSLDALLAEETRMLIGQVHHDAISIPEPEFDADAEAEKLAQMLESVGVMRSDGEEAAA